MRQHWRLHLLLPLRSHIQHGAAPASSQPLVAVADKEVWLQLLQVQRQHAKRMGSIN
jgi:hypothetical protein